MFVDPDGFLGDPAYDLGVALRAWCPQLLASNDPQSLARRYCRLLADGSGVDEQAIWEWGYLEQVTRACTCGRSAAATRTDPTWTPRNC